MAWYREWFGEDYLELYAHRDEAEAKRHVDFIEERLGSQRPRAVLDLACGAGRHTDELRRRGYRTLGIDLSLTLLARRPDLPRVRGDMRRLPFAPGTFDWVLNFFTSFGYFETERENFRVFEEVSRVLAPGGQLVVDLLNPDRVRRDLEPHEQREIEGRRVDLERWYDQARRRVNKRIRIEAADGSVRTYLESVRVYQPEEVRQALAASGLEVLAQLGGWDGGPHSPESERLILLTRKTGEPA